MFVTIAQREPRLILPIEFEIAVIIVSYRSAALTVTALKSLADERKQPGVNFHVFVVDNASGDHPHIVESVRLNDWNAWVTPLLAPLNGGFSYGNNFGIRRAFELGRPRFVYLLNPDTEVRPGGIKTLLEFLNANPSVGIAGSSFETEEGKDWPMAFRFPTVFSEFERGMQLGLVTKLLSRWTVPRVMKAVEQPIDWICGASMLIRTEVLLKIGCLDENFFLYYEETEFCYRARQAGFATWYVPKSRVMHMIGASTNLDDKARINRRLPGYWFDSRRRYFILTHGSWYAAFIDLVALVACSLGFVRRKVLNRPTTPHYIRDLLVHSALWSRNRPVAPLKSYFPAER